MLFLDGFMEFRRDVVEGHTSIGVDPSVELLRVLASKGLPCVCGRRKRFRRGMAAPMSSPRLRRFIG
jgi:hypothetical protein